MSPNVARRPSGQSATSSQQRVYSMVIISSVHKGLVPGHARRVRGKDRTLAGGRPAGSGGADFAVCERGEATVKIGGTAHPCGGRGAHDIIGRLWKLSPFQPGRFVGIGRGEKPVEPLDIIGAAIGRDAPFYGGRGEALAHGGAPFFSRDVGVTSPGF